MLVLQLGKRYNAESAHEALSVQRELPRTLFVLFPTVSFLVFCTFTSLGLLFSTSSTNFDFSPAQSGVFCTYIPLYARFNNKPERFC